MSAVKLVYPTRPGGATTTIMDSSLMPPKDLHYQIFDPSVAESPNPNAFANSSHGGRDSVNQIFKRQVTLAKTNMEAITGYIPLLKSLRKKRQAQRWATMSPYTGLNPFFAKQSEEEKAEQLKAAREAFIRVVEDLHAMFQHQSTQTFQQFYFEKAVELSKAYEQGVVNDTSITPINKKFAGWKAPESTDLREYHEPNDQDDLASWAMGYRPQDWPWGGAAEASPGVVLRPRFALYEDEHNPDLIFEAIVGRERNYEHIDVLHVTIEEGPVICVKLCARPEYEIEPSFGVLKELYAYDTGPKDGDTAIADIDEDLPVGITGYSDKLQQLALGILVLGFCQVQEMPSQKQSLVSIGAAFADA